MTLSFSRFFYLFSRSRVESSLLLSESDPLLLLLAADDLFSWKLKFLSRILKLEICGLCTPDRDSFAFCEHCFPVLKIQLLINTVLSRRRCCLSVHEKLFLRFVSSCNSGCDVRISAARPLPACDRHGCCIPRRSKWQAQITPTASATTPPRGRRRRKHTVYTSLSEPQKWLHKSPKVVVPESAESSFGRIYVPGVMNRRFSCWM